MLKLLAHRVEVLKITRDITEQTQAALGERQREAVLREQLHQLQKELGEGEDCGRRDRTSSRRRSPRRDMPAEVDEHARKELQAPAAHERGEPRVRHGAHLPRLAGGAAVEQGGRGGHRHRARAARARRGSLRPGQGEAAHSRVSRGAQAQPAGPQPDPVLRRSAGRGQDLPRAEHRARAGPEVRACEPGWCAR